MQQGMHHTIDLMRVENELLDRKLRYHYLIADERLRQPRPTFLSQLVESFRSLFTPRSMTSERGGI